MSNLSNDNGRGYEYACIKILFSQISIRRKCSVVKDACFDAAERAWNSLDDNQKAINLISASSIVETLFELEPLIIEKSDDVLELKLQPDECGKKGDVRDIVLIRCGINWEIGLSVKHNHFAVKHSRIAKTLDFAKQWFGTKCTDDYWNAIKPIFEKLEIEKKNKKEWKELIDKENNVYVPLLNAFINEIKRQYSNNNEIPAKMVEYLLGTFDFYKLIGVDSKKVTFLQSFNLHGTLSKQSRSSKRTLEIPIVDLPTRIVNIDFKPNSKNTIELYLNNGWQFSFRIHNASTNVETSLKFDIQIVGMPTTIVTIKCDWK